MEPVGLIQPSKPHYLAPRTVHMQHMVHARPAPPTGSALDISHTMEGTPPYPLQDPGWFQLLRVLIPAAQGCALHTVPLQLAQATCHVQYSLQLTPDPCCKQHHLPHSHSEVGTASMGLRAAGKSLEGMHILSGAGAAGSIHSRAARTSTTCSKSSCRTTRHRQSDWQFRYA